MSRTRSRRCTGGGVATSSTRSSTRCPRKSPKSKSTIRSSPSPSSAVRTSASPRCSTASSATTARSCTTCPAPRATRSTRSSRSEDGPMRFVDTAGMRRRSRIDEPTEYFSLVRALESVDRADARLLVIDATDGVTHQDQRLAERIDAAGTAVVVVLNKWELLDAEARATARGRRRRPPRVPVVRARPHHLRAHRAHDPAHPPGAAPGRGGLPPAGSRRPRSTG